MKKSLLSLFLAALFIMPATTKADEGMWIPMLIGQKNYEEMKAKGLKLTPEQLYSINSSSLKDAIVWFNGGCTGEIISSKGLVLTNHHCGYDAISELSTTADNILDNGFWAKNLQSERVPKKPMFVSIVVRIEDISQKVLAELAGVEEKDRANKLQGIFKTLTAEATKGTHYEAQCREMFKGNAYYLFVFEKFTDIRLVATPPQNIGKYGGDTDNWMWPRHTGDFSVFRIYAGKDGKPAPYSPDNVPYTPKHHLPVSIKGVKQGDYAMIMGFPGRTNRYEFSHGIKVAVNDVNPTIVDFRDIRLKAWKEQMDKDVATRLKLSSEYASIANYWKYFIGQTEQLKRLKVYEQKQALEYSFKQWAQGKAEYQNLFVEVDRAYAQYEKYAKQPLVLSQGIRAPYLVQNAWAFTLLKTPLTSKDTNDIKKLDGVVARLKSMLGEFETKKEIWLADKKMFAQVLYHYDKAVADDQKPAFFFSIKKKYKGNFYAYAEMVYKKSMFSDSVKLAKFLSKPSYKTLAADPAFAHYMAFANHYEANFKPTIDAFYETIGRLGRIYIKGLMEMNPDLVRYPDANSSIRLTYGTVESYEPRDAVKFEYFTTLEGVMEKYVPGDGEFDLPQSLINLYNKKDYGRYAMADGRLPVGFITNNDITGGNSGSPVINGDGYLIGLAFDGNWEAMSGDIVFDSKYKRTINVDIRYVLWTIEKIGGATNLINELTIIE